MEVEPLEREEEAAPDAGGATPVYDGKHVVPAGVAVEELDGGKQKLADECPAAVQDVLVRHGLVPVYESLVKGIVANGKTRGVFGGWKDKEFESVLDEYKDEFAAKGVKVALCKRQSGSGKLRWLEFIDVQVAPTYVPQYDVSNRSGQAICTVYNKLKFPKGVAVEELKRYGKARKALMESVPPYVEELLGNKGLMAVYQSMVDEMAEAGVGPFKGWDTPKLNAIAAAFKPKFAEKNVDVFLSQKQEYVSHGQYGGHNETCRWLEFVDRDIIPNYQPQRDADGKKNDCVVM